MRASMSNIRFRQPGNGARPSHRHPRPSEARTRLKNIRYIGAPRAVLGHQSPDADAFGLARHRRGFKARCRSSKISSFDSGIRVFGARDPPATVRDRLRRPRPRARDMRARRFETCAPTSNLCAGTPPPWVLSKVVTCLDIGPVANQSRPVVPIDATLLIRREGMQCHRT